MFKHKECIRVYRGYLGMYRDMSQYIGEIWGVYKEPSDYRKDTKRQAILPQGAIGP